LSEGALLFPPEEQSSGPIEGRGARFLLRSLYCSAEIALWQRATSTALQAQGLTLLGLFCSRLNSLQICAAVLASAALERRLVSGYSPTLIFAGILRRINGGKFETGSRWIDNCQHEAMARAP
jgi:hypothetical protein